MKFNNFFFYRKMEKEWNKIIIKKNQKCGEQGEKWN